MKKVWKRFDILIISVVAALVFITITMFIDVSLALTELFVMISACMYYLYIHKTKRNKLLFQIDKVAKELDFEQGRAFDRLGVSCAVVEQNGKIVWLNEMFKESFNLTSNNEQKNITQLIQSEKFNDVLNGDKVNVEVNSKYFCIHSNQIQIEDETIYLLYFFEETQLRLIEKEYYDTRGSIMLSVIDNVEGVYQNFDESDCTTIFSTIEKMIADWAFAHGTLCRKLSSTRTMIIAEERNLKKMIEEKFSIIDSVRNFKYDGKETGITLSIGVGTEKEINDASTASRLALDMAQSRGGDQVAIKNGSQYRFFGGVSEGKQKNNKVRARLMASSMSQIIKNSDNVLIMGHRFSDFDAFGSAVAMYNIAKYFGKNAKIVVNTKNTLAMPLVETFVEKHGATEIVQPISAPNHVRENTLVIVVDTHKKSFCDCSEIIDMAEKVIVIDHHRKSVDYIEDTVLFYHMPNSSSTAEMVTELIQYIDNKIVVDNHCALALLAGIVLDTRNFILRTSSRTFEAAAFLKSKGADTVRAKKLFSTDMKIFRDRNAVIDAAKEYNSCAISVVDFKGENMRLVTSQAADEMLSIDGVKASFVLHDTGEFVNISARSFGEVNVQLIMESLGGGGHQSMSACQIYDKSIDECKSLLEKSIDKYFEK